MLSPLILATWLIGDLGFKKDRVECFEGRLESLGFCAKGLRFRVWVKGLRFNLVSRVDFLHLRSSVVESQTLK